MKDAGRMTVIAGSPPISQVRRVNPRGVGLVVAGLLAAIPAGAQVVAPAERTVSGVVIDSLNGKPLGGVSVFLPGRRDAVTLGGDGKFSLQRLTLRDTLLVFRRIGYVPASAPVLPSADASVIDIGTVRMRPVATPLDRVAVEADEVRIYPHLGDFYRRKQLRLAGHFITREDIQKVSYRKTSDLIMRSSKVRIDCPDFNWQNQRGIARADPCDALNRRPQGRSGMEVGHCEMEVWVDGERSMIKIDEVPVAQIAGIEIYNGPATVPPAFGAGHCGVVAIWTKGAQGG
jgi:hypothetical protein